MSIVTSANLFAACDLSRVTQIIQAWDDSEVPPATVVGVTALGDYFYTRGGESEYVLFECVSRVATGSLIAADTIADYHKRTADREFSREYLCPQFVAELISDHGPLSPENCYSHALHQADLRDPSAYRICSVRQHFTIAFIMSLVSNRLPDNEPYDLRTLMNERRRLQEILRETYPRLTSED